MDNSQNFMQAALDGFKTVDGIFRQRRLDQIREEDRALGRIRAEAELKRDATNDAFLDEERAQKRSQWARESRAYRLNAIKAKVKAGGPEALTPEELADINAATKEQLTAIAQINSDIPLALKGDEGAKTRLLKNIGTADEARFTLGGTRYGRPTGIYGAPNTPGGFIVTGEFAEYKRDEKGNIVTDEKGNPVIDPATLRTNKPLTVGKSTDPNDPVNVYQIKDIMPKMLEKGKLLAAVQAELAGIGDATAIKEVDAENQRGAFMSILSSKATEEEKIKSLVGAGMDPAVAIKAVKDLHPEDKELGLADFGHGQKIFTNGPKKGQIVKVPVAPRASGGEGGSGAKALVKDIADMEKTITSNYIVEGSRLASGEIKQAATALVLASPQYGLGEILYQRDDQGRIRTDRMGVYIPNNILALSSSRPDPVRSPQAYNRWASHVHQVAKEKKAAINVPNIGALTAKKDISAAEAIQARRRY